MLKLLSSKLAAIVAIFAMTVLTAGAQNKAISGTVVDTAGEPVIGASVFVVGNTSNGAMTDLDGKFTLNVPANANISVSCIGYSTQVIPVGSQTVFNVILEADTQFLEETVVIGYGVQKKSDLTGAVASVREEEFANRSTSDAANALMGKAAGVQIISASGAPGSGSEIRVRGFSSNSGNIGPLLIVDGLQVDNIQYLDPEMIASMEVLKDAASAAIYGAQAGNGVVLITTKSGAAQKGTGKVFYNAQFSLSSLARKLDIMNAEEYIAFGKDYGWLNDTMLENIGYNGTDVNWSEEVFEPTWNSRHTVGFQAGSDKGNLFVSINNVSNNGIFAGDKDVYKRLSAQVNADYKIKPWLQVSTNTSIEKWSTKSVSQHSDNGSAMLAAITSSPLEPVRVDYDGLTVDMKNEMAKGNRILTDAETGLYWSLSRLGETQGGNPFIRRDATDATNEGINIRGTLAANLTPFKGFTFTSRFGYRINQSNSHSYEAPYYASSFVKATQYTLQANNSTGHYYQWENFANYNKTIAKKHNIGLMAGMSYIESNNDNIRTSATGPDILKNYAENFRYMNYLLDSDSVAKSISNAPGKSASIAYFGRLTYSYDNRYSVQANFRADAFDSSKLSKQNRWGYFPSFSAGWTISNEAFFKDNISRDVVSFLKLRASWGRNGNVSVLNNYAYATSINYGGSLYQYDATSPEPTLGSMPAGLANPDLTWETSDQLDAGIDAHFLNGKLVFVTDYYHKTTNDLLVGVSPSAALGVSSTTINAGSVVNSGFEFELTWKDQVGDFAYSVSANASTLKNKVTYLDPTISRIAGTMPQGSLLRTYFEQGYPIWYMRGYKGTGIDAQTGKPSFEDLNNDGSINEDDMQMVGLGIPKATFGLTINLAYKGFDMVIFGTGTAGSKIFPSSWRTDRPHCNTYSWYWENSWKKDGSNTNPKFPGTTYWDQQTFSSTYNLFDGSYFKIKQVQLGYTLPRKVLSKVGVSSLRVYASLENFFCFTSYPGLDPETASSGSASSLGIDMGSYPSAKQLILGLNLSF
jgi:TonB-linked SusC/RagA family outer membrane protein